MDPTTASFEELAASRRAWIDDVLRPWCEHACRIELIKAFAEWTNVAGNVDPDGTLWMWAWSRFPAIVNEELSGIDETKPIQVALQDGTTVFGYPDKRSSSNGNLVLIEPESGEELGPYSIDEIASASHCDES